MRLLAVLLATSALAADTDPVSDRMRFEVALAQRDFLVTRQQHEQAIARLRTAIAAADKACADKGKTFNTESFACVAKDEK